MAEPKWTPGPWFATNATRQANDPTMHGDQDDEGSVWTVSTDPNAAGWETDCGYSGYGVSEANARLMASAPDLYDALVAAEEELRLLRMKDTAVVYNPMLRVQISLALAKSRGETS